MERKETWKGDAPENSRRAVCAFANDLPDHQREGVLFVGVKDNGDPSGLTIDDRLLQTLADIKTDGKTLPPPTLTVEKRTLKGVDVAVVHVRPSDSPPVRYDGRIWIRVGPRRAVATAQDERILDEKRRYRDKPFDICPRPDATLKDLDLFFFQESYLPRAFPPDVLDANDRSIEQRLAALKMTVGPDDSTPTNLGVLVLSPTPVKFIYGSYVRFLRIDGVRLADPIVDAAEISGRLDRVIARTEEKLDAHNRTAVDITSSPLEKRTQLYPTAALEQVFRNAVMHRSYQGGNAPLGVTWFNDRIEIQSSGGPFGDVRVDNFGQPGLVGYRNPNIAEAMRVMGFAQRFGVGLDLARASLANNGSPEAEFIVSQTHVNVILRPAL